HRVGHELRTNLPRWQRRGEIAQAIYLMFVTAVWEISHTGQVKVRLSSGLIRAIHIGDPQLGQVGRLLGSEFGGVCVMALPIL
ncbi:MAG: hypothetical protein WCB55_16420, partial [Pseudolabrys sp.]